MHVNRSNISRYKNIYFGVLVETSLVTDVFAALSNVSRPCLLRRKSGL